MFVEYANKPVFVNLQQTMVYGIFPLLKTGTTPSVDKIPMQKEYESALEGDDDLDKKFEGICYHCGHKGHMSKDYTSWKDRTYEKFHNSKLDSIDKDRDE